MTAPSKPTALPRLDTAAWLTRSGTQAVFAALQRAGFDARAVGGAVRNSLLGRDVSDVDIATTAQPDEITAAATAAGLHAVPTGIAHGTVTVVSGRVPYEVTTLREDVETFGRHARVAFTRDWQADAARRDFTMNALYCDAAGTVFDPLGGYPDLVAERVRFIGDAAARIAEDYLRILRFFRFNAEYGSGHPDREGLEACIAARDGLDRLSGERLRGELLRLLAAPGGPEMAAVMETEAILPHILGRSGNAAALQRLAQIETASGRKPDAVLRLAALAVPAGDPAPDAPATRLRLSNQEARRLVAAADTGAPLPTASDDEIRSALYRSGRDATLDAILLDWARSAAPPGDTRRQTLLAAAAGLPIPVLPIRGADIIALGVPAGPRVGEILTAFENWWIAQHFPADPQRAMDKLRSLSAQF